MRKSLREKLGKGMIWIGSAGMIGGFFGNAYGNYLCERPLSNQTKAIYSVTEAFRQNNFTFGREYHESPDVIEAKRELKLNELGEPIANWGFYGGLASTIILCGGIITVPTTKKDE